jgi:hypothetical protein
MAEIAAKNEQKLEIPQAFMWVKDAPLFIDGVNLERFYDAVVRPPFKEGTPLKIKVSSTQKKELEAKFGGKAKIGLPAWLAPLFAAGAEVSGDVKKSNAQGESKEQEITLHPISTPHRQLEQLTIFYLLEQPARLLIGDINSPLSWQKDGYHRTVPRTIVFIDLPAGTKFIPMAAEFAEGKFVTFFDKLHAKSGERPPAFERSKDHEYWRWFSDNFDAGQCVDELEKASTENGRIEWIDFRVPLNDRADTLHLHLEVGGQYNTGTFAYRLIRRGVHYGIRLVGTLKDGPDVNVLALYEK